jgi:hypothetical protein
VVVVLVLVGFAMVGWVVAGRIVERFASLGSRSDGTALAVDLPPVPTAQPRLAVPEPAPGDGGPAGLNLLLAPPVTVPRPVRRCGNCRAVGHTRPACPRLTGALPLPHL